MGTTEISEKLADLQLVQEQDQNPTNLYVVKLPRFMQENDLEGMFSPFGQVLSTRILRYSNTGISRGIGFCKMEQKDQCEAAIKAFEERRNKGNNGRQNGVMVKYAKNQYLNPRWDSLTVKFARNQFPRIPRMNRPEHAEQPNQDPTNLFIAKLPRYLRESDLHGMFMKLGQVISTRILRYPSTGISKGVGFCLMEDNRQCLKIIEEFHGKPITGGKIIAENKNQQQQSKGKNEVTFTGEEPTVFFDLETTGLRPYSDEIVQIGACCGDKEFGVYIDTTSPIHAEAAKVNKLHKKGNSLYKAGLEVQTVSSEKALNDFLTFVNSCSKDKKPILLAHNGKRFDVPFLSNGAHKIKTDLHKKFTESIVGFVDTYILARDVIAQGEVINYKLPTLYKKYLERDYPAHEAVEDAKALQEVYLKVLKEKATPENVNIFKWK